MRLASFHYLQSVKTGGMYAGFDTLLGRRTENAAAFLGGHGKTRKTASRFAPRRNAQAFLRNKIKLPFAQPYGAAIGGSGVF